MKITVAPDDIIFDNEEDDIGVVEKITGNWVTIRWQKFGSMSTPMDMVDYSLNVDKSWTLSPNDSWTNDIIVPPGHKLHERIGSGSPMTREADPMPPVMTLNAFDFDHTLVATDAKIKLKKTGERLGQAQFDQIKTRYIDLPDEAFDFSEFDGPVQGKINKRLMKHFIDQYQNPEVDVFILTARGNPEPVYRFISKYVKIKPEHIVSVNAPDFLYSNMQSDADKKKFWIKDMIEEGYNYIEFWDDSSKNCRAVEELLETHPGIEIHVHLSDMTLNEIEKFQRSVKRKHRRNKSFLVKHGKQRAGKPYTRRASTKRSKSAPPMGE